MTGRGMGMCVLRIDGPGSAGLIGFVGAHGLPLRHVGTGRPPVVKAAAQDKNKEETDMPRGDGTGPMGMGPMTGRAAGFCAGYRMPGYMNAAGGHGFGMGFGRGRGGGRGWRNMFYATGLTGWQRAARGWPAWGGIAPVPQPTKEQEMDALKSQAEFFENALGEIRKRLSEIEAEKKA